MARASCTHPDSSLSSLHSAPTKCTHSHLMVPFHIYCQPPRMLGEIWFLLRCQRHSLVVLHLTADTPAPPLLHYRTWRELVAG